MFLLLFAWTSWANRKEAVHTPKLYPAHAIFFIAILSLEAGSAFPCTFIIAFALYVVIRRLVCDYLWDRSGKESNVIMDL